MTARNRLAALAVASSVSIGVVLGGAGCGGPSSYDDFRDQLSSRYCDYLIRCGQIGASETSKCPVAPPLGLQSTDGLDIDASIDRGALAFHGGRAQSCLDALGKLPCQQAQAGSDLTRSCNAIVEGRLAPGKPCSADAECLGGGCQQPLIGAACGGTCVAFAATGAACELASIEVSVTCDPTVHYCDGVCKLQKSAGAACANDAQCTFDLACVDGKCANPPRIATGKECGVALPPCQDGLGCSSKGVCAPRLAAGAACLGDDECKDGTACVNAVCSAWSDLGKACFVADTGFSGCPADQSCPSAICIAGVTPAAGVGQTCSSDGGCGAGLWCNNGSCGYQSGLAGSCRADDNCTSGLVCDPTTQKCRPSTC